MREPARQPDAEIQAGNPWYVESQFLVQLGSSTFRAVVEHRWQIFERAIDEWVRARNGEPPARLLDAGCGDGINLSFLNRMVGARGWPTAIVGADYSALRVGRARELSVARVMRGSVTNLACRDRSFDVVICNQVLEHVPEYERAFSELHRVLRPGGLLIVGVPNEGSALGVLRNHVLQRSILRSTDHVNMFTRESLLAAFQQAHFDVTRVEVEGLFVPHTVLHFWLNRYQPFKRFFDAIGRTFPRCAAGLFVVATRAD